MKEQTTKPKSKKIKECREPNPIDDMFSVSRIGAEDINFIMAAARAFPMLQAYGSPDGSEIALAERKPKKWE